MSHFFNNLLGKRFGRLLVIKKTSVRKFRSIVWLCKCDCGNTLNVRASSLTVTVGHTQSCGCLQREKATLLGLSKKIHGKTFSQVYRAYKHMINRCYRKKNEDYYNYGGRGITVCKRWLGKMGFIHFYEDMGDPPRGKSLDRYPNNVTGNYEPSNCRWATLRQQARNKRNFTKTKNRRVHNFFRKEIHKVLQKIIHNTLLEESKYTKYLSCSPQQFRDYFQSQFEPWMTWDNYGFYRKDGPKVWNIDHIISVYEFDLSVERNRYKCFHYTNLRPFSGKDNDARKIG